MTKKKKVVLGLIFTLLIIQFFKPKKNDSNDDTYHVSTKYPMSQELSNIMKAACYDCHSNKTNYPWYSKIQPVAWWLNGHVNGGKKHLNLSAFTNRKIAIQNHKFEEIVEMVEEKHMPLASYTNFGLHKDAKLTQDQRNIIVSWAKTSMDSIRNHFPADSLILKKKG